MTSFAVILPCDEAIAEEGSTVLEGEVGVVDDIPISD